MTIDINDDVLGKIKEIKDFHSKYLEDELTFKETLNSYIELKKIDNFSGSDDMDLEDEGDDDEDENTIDDEVEFEIENETDYEKDD